MFLEAVLIVVVAGFVLGAMMLFLTASPARVRMIEESHERAARAKRQVTEARELRARTAPRRRA